MPTTLKMPMLPDTQVQHPTNEDPRNQMMMTQLLGSCQLYSWIMLPALPGPWPSPKHCGI